MMMIIIIIIIIIQLFDLSACQQRALNVYITKARLRVVLELELGLKCNPRQYSNTCNTKMIQLSRIKQRKTYPQGGYVY
jgi:hypothetical protein